MGWQHTMYHSKVCFCFFGLYCSGKAFKAEIIVNLDSAKILYALEATEIGITQQDQFTLIYCFFCLEISTQHDKDEEVVHI